MTDNRRETIAWALRIMRDYKEGRRQCVSTQMRAGHHALPVAAELIEELTQKANVWEAIAHAVNPEAAKNAKDVIARFEEMHATIATQAKEIEGLVTAEQEEGPKEMNLERVLKASERASEQVASWPEWKRKLGSAEQEEGT